MNRTRTGRGAPPWAWMQTGPLTVDVEACMSNRDRECERIPANIHTEAVFAERADAATERVDDSALVADAAEHAPTERFATVKCIYIEPGSSAECDRIPESAPELESVAEKTGNLIDQFPGFKAAMESFEKRGIPLFTDAEPSAAKSATKRPCSKARPAKRKRNLLAARKSQRPSVPRKQSQPKTQAQIDVLRHRRVCTICHHPEREAIEEAFLQWRRVKNIDQDFKPEGGPTAIYRHARAFNLFKQRNLGLRSALEFVIERAENVVPTAEGLVKAIRAYTRINDAGEWIDTPTTHIVKVFPMAHDGRPLENPATGLTLDVRKDRSNILYPTPGQIESAAYIDAGSAHQPLLPGSAQQVENDVTH